IQGAGTDVVEDSYLGTAADGLLNGIASGNFVGIRLRPTTSGNRIGLPGHGNLLSNNTGAGVSAQPGGGQCYGTAPNVIQSNRIGTNAAGTQAIPNFVGISIFETTNVTMGGTAAGTSNLISGNTDQGVTVSMQALSGCGA